MPIHGAFRIHFQELAKYLEEKECVGIIRNVDAEMDNTGGCIFMDTEPSIVAKVLLPEINKVAEVWRIKWYNLQKHVFLKVKPHYK